MRSRYTKNYFITWKRMMSWFKKPNNMFFCACLAGLLLVVFAFIPRPVIFLLAGAIAGWMWANPWQKAALFFVRFIPFFFALPLTETFDNFNMWRIAILIVFIKMIWEERAYFLPLLRTSIDMPGMRAFIIGHARMPLSVRHAELAG